MDRAIFLQGVQGYVANVAIGSSTLRNQGPSGVVGAARSVLANLRLDRLRGTQPAQYGVVLDEWTRGLMRSFPRGARRNWGAARKAINIFMAQASMNWHLAREYGLRRLVGALEVPLDAQTSKALRSCARRRQQKLPTWRGVKRLTSTVNREYQEFALDEAKRRGIPRPCLDLFLWRAEPRPD